MKRIMSAATKLAVSFVMVTVLAAAQFGFATPAHAEKVPTVIIFIDMQTLFLESEVGKDVDRQWREQEEALKNEDLTTRQAFLAEEKALNEQVSELTEEEVQTRYEDLTQRKQMHLAKVDRRKQALKLGLLQARAEINGVLSSILSEILKKYGAGILLDRSMVVAGGLDLDITSEAIALLNQRLTKLTVTPVDPESIPARQ